MAEVSQEALERLPADAVVGTRYLPTVLAHIDSEKMET
jgi:hypothetical protein